MNLWRVVVLMNQYLHQAMREKKMMQRKGLNVRLYQSDETYDDRNILLILALSLSTHGFFILSPYAIVSI